MAHYKLKGNCNLDSAAMTKISIFNDKYYRYGFRLRTQLTNNIFILINPNLN